MKVLVENSDKEGFDALMGKNVLDASFEEQLAFVDWELRNTEKSAGQRLSGATSAQEATALIAQHYERPYAFSEKATPIQRTQEASRRAGIATNITQLPMQSLAPQTSVSANRNANTLTSSSEAVTWGRQILATIMPIAISRQAAAQPLPIPIPIVTRSTALAPYLAVNAI